MKNLACLLALPFVVTARADPPFAGTIFIDPDIIDENDPSLFEGSKMEGEEERTVFDRRVNAWVTTNLQLFSVAFITGQVVEARVNLEFDAQTAKELTDWYATVIGRIPIALLRDLESITIHDGVQPFGGGNRNLLIHHGQGELYSAEGILEEAFVHEAAHTSLDADHSADADWLKAQKADGEFISNYARDFPDREDIAESILVFLAAEFRPDRISGSMLNTIVSTIPNRLAYFRNESLNWYPVGPQAASERLSFSLSPSGLLLSWPISLNPERQLMESYDAIVWEPFQGDVTMEEGRNFARIELQDKRRRLFRMYHLSHSEQNGGG